MVNAILSTLRVNWLTSSNSTYITDLIDIQDKVLDAANLSLQKCHDKHKKSTPSVAVFPVGSYVLVNKNTLLLGYTQNGKVRYVSFPLRDPSMFSRT